MGELDNIVPCKPADMKKYFSLLATALPLAALAHPGHGGTHGWTITHYFVEPQHAITTVLAVGGILLIARFVRKRSSENHG